MLTPTSSLLPGLFLPGGGGGMGSPLKVAMSIEEEKQGGCCKTSYTHYHPKEAKDMNHTQSVCRQTALLERANISKEEPPHSPANALAVIQNVKLVHKLVHGVAGLGDGAKVCHEAHVIALLRGRQKEAG